MRMRKKKHGAERIAACSELLIEDTSLLATLGEEGNPIFTESRPIHMEIGCGKGNFAVGMAAAKAQGKVRSEGKEYVMKDGDIVNFLFNV